MSHLREGILAPRGGEDVNSPRRSAISWRTSPISWWRASKRVSILVSRRSIRPSRRKNATKAMLSKAATGTAIKAPGSMENRLPAGGATGWDGWNGLLVLWAELRVFKIRLDKVDVDLKDINMEGSTRITALLLWYVISDFVGNTVTNPHCAMT